MGTVPANATALPLHRSYQEGKPLAPLALVRASTGQPVPYTLHEGEPAWLQLDAPLVAGETYTLTVPTGCTYLKPDGTYPPAEETLTFVAGPVAPIPSAAGTLVLGATTLQDVRTSTIAGSCTVAVNGASQTVQLQPDSSLVPWLGLASLALLAEAQTWSTSRTGDIAVAGQPLPQFGDWGHRTSWNVYAVCQLLPEHASPGLQPGTPLLTARIHLPPGMATLETTAQANLLCEQPEPEPDAGADGTSEDGTSTDGGSAQDDADAGAVGAPPLPLAPNAGCTTARRALPAQPIALLAGVLVVLSVRRRTRAPTATASAG